MNRILLVEDDPNFVFGIEYTLSSEGYGVTTAGTLEDARKAMKSEEMDLILLDVNLPIIFYGFIGVIILIAFLNIINTVSTNLILRTKEFAVLKAIGMTQRDVRKMILLEGLFYGLFSGISGILIGAALSYGIQFLYQNTLDTAWGIPWMSMGLALFGALFTTFLATMLPMRRLNRVPIVQALRAEE